MARTSVKDKVLQLLDEKKGSYFSGQELADQLQVSRQAIWKAIETLRKEGYDIVGTTKNGYCLSPEADVLHIDSIVEALEDEARKFYQISCEKVIPSTNDAIRTLGMEGSAEGCCMIAEEQTAGKGRRGRSFYSPKATGVYLSVLLRPKVPFEQSVLITTAAAAAAAKACEDTNPYLHPGEVGIKWVNDLFLHGKKFCGILTEGFLSMESGGLEYAVCGIGFNLKPPKEGWPEELSHVAGSLFDEEAISYDANARNRLVSSFLNYFYQYYKNLEELTFLEEYKKRQIAIGKDVFVIQADGTSKKAKAIGVDDRCQLLVQFENQDKITALNSGEISVKLTE